MTLIQIISGETLQNVLPILALKPARVISVVSTANKVFLAKTRDIENAIKLAWPKFGSGPVPDFVPDPVSAESDSPSIENFHKVVGQVIAQNSEACVNYTGGTKDMSIGAWLAAREAGVPTLYCDTPRLFRSGDTAPLNFPMQLGDVARRLDVPAILAAHGLLQGQHWKVYKETGARIAFGRISFELLLKDQRAVKGVQRAIVEHGNAGQKKRPNRDDLTRVLQRAVELPEGEIARQFLDAASRAGLMVHRRDGWFIGPLWKGNPRVQLDHLDKTLMQLTGGAYEGFIHDRLERSPRFTAFLHGVMPASASEDSTFGETDFLAFEPGRTRLVLISCKSSPPSLEHLEATLARKAHFGGRFAHSILCIKSALDKKREYDIRKQCDLLSIECLIGSEVENAFATNVTA